MKVNVFSSDQYRIYLKNWLAEARELRIANLNILAKKAQVHPTFLSQVLAGRKDLSLEQASLLSEYLEHSPLERDYFFVLVQLDRAGHLQLKKYWSEKKEQLLEEKNKLGRRFDSHLELTDQERAVFYSSWLYSALRICTAIDQGQSALQLTERVRLPKSKVTEILNFLVSTGVCLEEEGIYRIGAAHIHVPNESPFVIKHHTNWRMRAIHEMDQRQKDELYFTAPMSISEKDFAVIREKLNQIIREVVDQAKASEAQILTCLNIDFFRTK